MNLTTPQCDAVNSISDTYFYQQRPKSEQPNKDLNWHKGLCPDRGVRAKSVRPGRNRCEGQGTEEPWLCRRGCEVAGRDRRRFYSFEEEWRDPSAR